METPNSEQIKENYLEIVNPTALLPNSSAGRIELAPWASSLWVVDLHGFQQHSVLLGVLLSKCGIQRGQLQAIQKNMLEKCIS